MAALDDFKTLLIGKASTIQFDIDQAQFLVAIDNWFPLAQARQSIASNSEIKTYSIGDRSFTRNELPTLIKMEQSALNAVMAFLKLSGEGLIDTRWFEGNRVGIYTS